MKAEASPAILRSPPDVRSPENHGTRFGKATFHETRQTRCSWRTQLSAFPNRETVIVRAPDENRRKKREARERARARRNTYTPEGWRKGIRGPRACFAKTNGISKGKKMEEKGDGAGSSVPWAISGARWRSRTYAEAGRLVYQWFAQ